MRTRRFAAAVLALAAGMSGGVAARAGEPPSPIRQMTRGTLAIEMKPGAQGRNLVGIEALPGGRIGLHVRVPGQEDYRLIVESLPGDRLRIIDRDEHTLECARLTLNLRRDEPARADNDREERLDELDEARARKDLLEMEVEALKEHLKRMSSILWETRVQQLQGFSNGPTLGAGDADRRKEIVDEYQRLLAEVQAGFLVKSKELSRLRRRIAELEAGLPLAAAASRPRSSSASGEFGWKDVDRILDLILRGMETWRQSSPPSRSSSPDQNLSGDEERILELIRKGMESWQRPDSPPLPPGPTPAPVPSPAPAPEASPVDPDIRDAERILELILRGVESWQQR